MKTAFPLQSCVTAVNSNLFQRNSRQTKISNIIVSKFYKGILFTIFF